MSKDVETRKEAAEALQQRSLEADRGFGGLTGLTDEDEPANLQRFRKEAKPLVSVLGEAASEPARRMLCLRSTRAVQLAPTPRHADPLSEIILDKNNSCISDGGWSGPAFGNSRRRVRDGNFSRASLMPSSAILRMRTLRMKSFPVNRTMKASLGGCGVSWFAVLLILSGRTSIEVPTLVEITPAVFPRRLPRPSLHWRHLRPKPGVRFHRFANSWPTMTNRSDNLPRW